MSGLVMKNVNSPLGRLQLVATADVLVAVHLPDERPLPHDAAVPVSAQRVLDLAERELAEYFRGERTTFTVPVQQAGTVFQESVWRTLCTIPFGETRSYTWLAAQVGRPRAVRAVGSANGRNAVPIIVPCHRVIRAGGELGGYGGGLDAKRWLLAQEQRVLAGAAAAVPRLARIG